MGFLEKAKAKWDAMVGAGKDADRPVPERMQMPKRSPAAPGAPGTSGDASADNDG